MPRRPFVAVEPCEQQARGLAAEQRRILGYHRHAGGQQVGQREIAEADQRDLVFEPGVLQGAADSMVIGCRPDTNAVGGSVSANASRAACSAASTLFRPRRVRVVAVSGKTSKNPDGPSRAVQLEIGRAHV